MSSRPRQLAVALAVVAMAVALAVVALAVVAMAVALAVVALAVVAMAVQLPALPKRGRADRPRDRQGSHLRDLRGTHNW